MHERNNDRDCPLVSLLEAKADSPPRPPRTLFDIFEKNRPRIRNINGTDKIEFLSLDRRQTS